MNCEHKIIHTERLLERVPENLDDIVPHVIESYCADCGLHLKSVVITYQGKGKKSLTEKK